MRFAPAAPAALLLTFLATTAGAQVDCEAARCAVQAAIDQACPCDQASNHGRHVSCVAHVVKRLSRDGTIPTNCKGKVMRCAARSTCGKSGTVTCHFPIDVCNLTTDPVSEVLTGTCAANPTIACLTDIDCGSRCRTRHAAEICEAQSGVVGTSGSCCAACVAVP